MVARFTKSTLTRAIKPPYFTRDATIGNNRIDTRYSIGYNHSSKRRHLFCFLVGFVHYEDVLKKFDAQESLIVMQQGQILIADDDAVLRLDLKTMLEAIGHVVVGEAENGESAVLMARNLKPDLIMMDIMMPKMNGLLAAEAIGRERLGPVMLLTAYSDVPMIEQANRAGVLAYLVKPYRQQELQPAIEIAMARYREMLALEGAVTTAQDQIESNRIIGKAKRVLMDKHSVGDQEAFRRLTAQSLATKRSLREISEAILLAEDMTSAIAQPRRNRP